MPRVKIHVTQGFNVIGVGVNLQQIGVMAPMHYCEDGSGIVTVLTAEQIDRFKNSRGAAHRVEEFPDAPVQATAPPVAALFVVADPIPEEINFPQCFEKEGCTPFTAYDRVEADAARTLGYSKMAEAADTTPEPVIPEPQGNEGGAA